MDLKADFVDRLKKLDDMYKSETGSQSSGVSITDGFRTYAEQVDLKSRKPGLAATPGRSHHGDRADGTGRDAADLKFLSPEARRFYHQNANRVGLGFPMGNEPWHIQSQKSIVGGETFSQRQRRMISEGVQTTPQGAISNVPPPTAIPPANGAMNMQGGSMSPVAIHIQGGNHDPQALATLVQRRIEETMNWRGHDFDYNAA
jgi:hypothetical protein